MRLNTSVSIAALVLFALPACTPATPVATTAETRSDARTQHESVPVAETVVVDDGHGEDGTTTPPDQWHGSWRVVARDDPHEQALMAISIQSSAGELEGSGDYILFQPFCDAVAGQPISGVADCELIGQGAAFESVKASDAGITLLFRPTADGQSHRLLLRREGERLAGDYVVEGNDMRRPIVATAAPTDPP